MTLVRYSIRPGCDIILILVDTAQVEPILLLGARPKESGLAVHKGSVKPFITDIAHSVKRQFGASLLQQDRLDDNVVRFRRFPVVIDQSASLQHIKSGQVPGLVRISGQSQQKSMDMELMYARGIIMVPVNRKDWNGNINIGILVIHVVECARLSQL